ncbi:MAG: hypothetical protein KAU17_10365, partial [Spirochaetales bacterium]|nr:hypothetical protein [Spirochaetales bacterium]
MSNNIDGTMIIILTDAYSDQAYIPETTKTTGSATVIGNTIYGESTTDTYGGFYVSKPRVRFEVSLYSVAIGEIVWKATTFTAGNAFAGEKTLVKSLSRKVVYEYAKELGY